MTWLLPPHLWLLSLIAMAVLDRRWPVATVLPEPYHYAGIYAGIAVALSGAVVLFGAWLQFRRAETNIHTFRDPDRLVTDGFFAWSRNPMYLGFATTLLGKAMIVNALSAYAVAILFVAIVNFWYIPYEERAAAARFPDAYDAYRRRVRRWL